MTESTPKEAAQWIVKQRETGTNEQREKAVMKRRMDARHHIEDLELAARLGMDLGDL